MGIGKFIRRTNYPTAYLEGTFEDKFYKDVVEPAKAGTKSKPSLGQLIKNWRPHKAFMPQSMGGTFYTKGTPAALKALRGSGIVGAATLGVEGGAKLGNWAYKNWEPATKFGDWIGSNIYDAVQNYGKAQASIPTQDDKIKAGIQKQMINEGTVKPMGRTYGNMSMGQGRPDWVADRSPVQQGLKEIEIGMAPFVANRIPGQQDLASDFFMDSITKDSKFYNPYKPTFRDQIKKGFNKYAKPVMGGIMSAVSGIPGMGLLMNAFQQDPYAQNRIDMYGAYRGRDGAIKDKFGYNVGSTLMKNRFMEPGSNSYRSYALDAMRGMDRAGRRPALDNYYQQTYGKTWDQVKKDHQQKKDPFNNTNPFAGTADNFSGGNQHGQSYSGKSDRPGGSSSFGQSFHGAKGGIASLWRR